LFLLPQPPKKDPTIWYWSGSSVIENATKNGFMFKALVFSGSSKVDSNPNASIESPDPNPVIQSWGIAWMGIEG
jgi:hypothetical protein